MLAHRLRRWPSIETTLVQCLLFLPQLVHSATGTMFESIGYLNITSQIKVQKVVFVMHFTFF